jgi:hypothetical protein
MLGAMMMDAMQGDADSAAEDKAKADDLRQAHGQVQSGTKESFSRSHRLSSEDPTRQTQQ